MIAHVGAVPLEELVPALAGAGSGLLAVRAWIMLHVRRRRVVRAWIMLHVRRRREPRT